jgi:cysteine desulfurase/selenocysteine lyase
MAFVEDKGVMAIRKHEKVLTDRLIKGLKRIRGARVYGTQDAGRQIAVVSFNVEGKTCSEVAEALEDRAGICCRAGLHCAPMAHRQIGTFPGGTVRFSMGMFNNETEIDTALGALREIAEQAKGGRQ